MKLQRIAIYFAAVALPSGARAQDGASGELFHYVDTTWGYELTLPTGWKYDATNVPAADGAESVYRGASADDRSRLDIFVYSGARVADFPAWAQQYEQRLRATGGLVRAPLRFDVVLGRRSGRFEHDLISGGVQRTQHLLIAVDPMTVWALVVTSPRAGTDARIEIDQLLRGLMFNAVPVREEEAEEAFRNGRRLLSVLKNHAADVRVDDGIRYYRIVEEERAVGYFAQFITRTRRDTGDPKFGGAPRDGLRLYEQSWRFEPDGIVRHEALDTFASFDGETEFIEERTVQIPPEQADPKLPKLPVLDRRHEATRDNNVIVSSVRRNVDQSLPVPLSPLRVDANYLSRAWLAVLPGLLADWKDETHAFTVYHPRTRALRAHIVRPLGPLQAEDDSPHARYAFEIQERFGGPRTRMVTPASGWILEQTRGTQQLVSATAEEIEREFGRQRAAAEQRLSPR